MDLLTLDTVSDNLRIVSDHQRRHHPVSLQQAAQESPVLVSLFERLEASRLRLRAIEDLLPRPIRSAIQAGPLDNGQWCLLVSSNAVASKLRQLLPSLRAHLLTHGLPVQDIRIKVRAPT